jgi:hypothetical protein
MIITGEREVVYMNSGHTRLALVVVAVAFSGMVANTAFAGGPVVLRGVVLDPEGNPLAGATVLAVAKGSDIQRTTRSNKKGKFGLRLPDCDPIYRLTIELEGYFDGVAELRPDPENNPSLTVTLVPVGEDATAEGEPPDSLGEDEMRSSEPAT